MMAGSARARRRAASVGLLLVQLLVAVACGADNPGPASSPGGAAAAVRVAGCGALTAPPAARPPTATARAAAPRSASGAVAPVEAQPPRRPLPDVTLPCYVDDAPIRVSALRGPAIVNLWASWCEPCRHELPVLQRYADRANGRVHVVGVVTEDTRDASRALASDLNLRFPQLYDSSARLRRLLNRAALPITLFVDREGQIRLLYNAEALDDDTLERLAEQQLGVLLP